MDHDGSIDGTSTVTKIMDGIFVSGVDASQDIEFITAHKITGIINCAGIECPDILQQDNIKYLTFKWPHVSQQPLSQISYFDSSGRIINKIYKFIEYHRVRGDGVLIHSIDAQCRSPVACAAYLTKKLEWSIERSIQYIKSKQNISTQAIALLKQLQQCLLNNNILPDNNRYQSCDTLHSSIIGSVSVQSVRQWQIASDLVLTEPVTSTTALNQLLCNTYINTYLHLAAAFDDNTQFQCSHTRTIKWADQHNSNLLLMPGNQYSHQHTHNQNNNTQHKTTYANNNTQSHIQSGKPTSASMSSQSSSSAQLQSLHSIPYPPLAMTTLSPFKQLTLYNNDSIVNTNNISTPQTIVEQPSINSSSTQSTTLQQYVQRHMSADPLSQTIPQPYIYSQPTKQRPSSARSQMLPSAPISSHPPIVRQPLPQPSRSTPSSRPASMPAQPINNAKPHPPPTRLNHTPTSVTALSRTLQATIQTPRAVNAQRSNQTNFGIHTKPIRAPSPVLARSSMGNCMNIREANMFGNSTNNNLPYRETQLSQSNQPIKSGCRPFVKPSSQRPSSARDYIQNQTPVQKLWLSGSNGVLSRAGSLKPKKKLTATKTNKRPQSAQSFDNIPNGRFDYYYTQVTG